MYWICDKFEPEMPEYIHQVQNRSIKAIYHLATARVWVDNIRKEANIVKRKGQFYIQTWHGSIALKRIEQDAGNSLNPFYISYAKRDAKYTNLMLSNSNFSDNMFSKSFWYKGEVYKSGSPRLDSMFKNNDGCVRRKLGLAKDDYIVLYAPTFRSDWSLEPYQFDRKKIKEAFEKRTGKNVVILFRMHPNLSKIMTYTAEESFVCDVSGVQDVYELMSEADALLTDYSSLMFEFPIAIPKPVFIYAMDYEKYDRGYYFDFSELPFIFTKNEYELNESIINFCEEEYTTNVKAFYDRLQLFEDGKSSERVADVIIEKIGTK